MKFTSLNQFEQYLLKGNAARNDHYIIERVQQAVEILGNPQLKYKVVHVGGTSGKGSTCQMIYSILRAAGNDVGLFTSPGLASSLERAQINGRLITEHQVLHLVNHYWSQLKPLQLTSFEWFVVVSFLWFAEQKVDYAVIEVGVGGVLDATNVVQPAVAVVTDVGLDHTALLGKTKATIARKKAAIIQKPGVLGFTGSRYVKVGRYIDLNRAIIHDTNLHGTTFSYKKLKQVQLNVIGAFQVRNAILAITVAQALHISDAAIREGLQHIHLRARFEIVSRDPLIIMDGAHNPQKMSAFISSFKTVIPNRQYEHCIALISLKYSKDLVATLRPLTKLADKIIITGFSESHNLQTIKKTIANLKPDLPLVIIAQSTAAYRYFLMQVKPHDVGVITGSLYLISDLLRKKLV